MKIVKAEILWTRNCNLSCNYCDMATGELNSFPIDRWIKTIDNLKELDCKLIAFYGAEPLSDFDKLPIVVGYAEGLGIDTTVITSGAVDDFEGKLKILNGVGLRSLTMSYDIVSSDDESSQLKTDMAVQGLEYFKTLKNIRDVAVVVTLNSKNFKHLPRTIKEMSAKGIWTFFDFIHGDRGQRGSKCNVLLDELAFNDDNYHDLVDVLEEVKMLKGQGFRCHTSSEFIHMVEVNDFELLRAYKWKCSKSEVFPSWVTIDCDGKVYACDDFQNDWMTYGDQLCNNWLPFCKFMRKSVEKHCPGCCWNTHIDANLIKEGKLDIGSYIHEEI